MKNDFISFKRREKYRQFQGRMTNVELNVHLSCVRSRRHYASYCFVGRITSKV